MLSSCFTEVVRRADPIEPILTEDGFLKADRTTLGADDAIGMAAALALLEVRFGCLSNLVVCCAA